MQWWCCGVTIAEVYSGQEGIVAQVLQTIFSFDCFPWLPTKWWDGLIPSSKSNLDKGRIARVDLSHGGQKQPLMSTVAHNPMEEFASVELSHRGRRQPPIVHPAPLPVVARIVTKVCRIIVTRGHHCESRSPCSFVGKRWQLERDDSGH